MSERITIDLYSGIPNPTWPIDERTVREWRARQSALRSVRPDPRFLPPHRSGFKGMTITMASDPSSGAYTAIGGFVFERGTNRAWVDHGREAERWLFSTAPAEVLGDYGLTYELLTAPREGLFAVAGIGGAGIVGGISCPHAPTYPGNTGVWKGGVSAHMNPNNCYSYANNDPISFSDYGIPGPLTTDVPTTTAKMRKQLALDKLGVLSPANELPPSCPVALPAKEAHFIAVCWRKMVGSQRDFHCFRMDRDGKWSHKDGTGEVTKSDSTGAIITDLRTAQFDWKLTLIGFFASVEGTRVID